MIYSEIVKVLARFGIPAVAVLAAAYFLYLTTQSTTPKESALSALLLTMLSIVASWTVSHHYAMKASDSEITKINEGHKESLRTYALKAAEKVTNLSNELDRLSTYLVAYRDSEENEKLDLVLCCKEERLTAAIHIVQMLKSVNDTSLSDWQGVIGDELDRKREQEEEEKQEQFSALISKMDEVRTSVDNLGHGNPNAAEALRKEISSTRAELLNALSGATGVVSPRPIRSFSHHAPVGLAACPTCKTEIKVKISKNGKVIVRGYICPSCRTPLVAKPDDHGNAGLVLRHPEQESFTCPACGEPQSALVDNLAGGSNKLACEKCNAYLVATRNHEGIVVREMARESRSKQMSITAEFVERVKAELPAQPWPTGVHKTVAEKLGVETSAVQKAIKVLILGGVCKNQIDGAVVEESARSSHHEEL